MFTRGQMDGRLILHRRLYLVLSLGSDFLRVVFLLLVVMIYCGIGLAADHGDVRVEITAVPNSGKAPMCVHLEPKIGGLEKPIKFEWSFGRAGKHKNGTAASLLCRRQIQ